MAKVTGIRIVIVNKDSLLATASCVIEGCICIKRIRIVTGARGLFISMPAVKKAGADYEELVFPINQRTRNDLSEALLGAYREQLKKEMVGQP